MILPHLQISPLQNSSDKQTIFGYLTCIIFELKITVFISFLHPIHYIHIYYTFSQINETKIKIALTNFTLPSLFTSHRDMGRLFRITLNRIRKMREADNSILLQNGTV